MPKHAQQILDCTKRLQWSDLLDCLTTGTGRRCTQPCSRVCSELCTRSCTLNLSCGSTCPALLGFKPSNRQRRQLRLPDRWAIETLHLLTWCQPAVQQCFLIRYEWQPCQAATLLAQLAWLNANPWLTGLQQQTTGTMCPRNDKSPQLCSPEPPWSLCKLLLFVLAFLAERPSDRLLQHMQ